MSISLERSAQLVDAYNPAGDGQRAPITDEQLLAAYATNTDLDIVVRPAEVSGPFGLEHRNTVSNYMTLGNLGLSGIMRVRRGGRAEMTINTVPPTYVEGQLTRLGNNNMPAHQELAPDQLTFIPDANSKYRDLDLRNDQIDIR